MRLLSKTGVAIALLLTSPVLGAGGAGAQTAAVAQAGIPASAGPGRVICRTVKTCVLGIGDPAKISYQINIQALPEADRARLTKQCKPKGKTPCVATIVGTEMGDPVKVKAATIKWFN